MTPFRTLTVSLLFIAAAPQQGFAASQIGVAAAVNQSAVGTAPGSKVRTVVLGDNVVFNESVETNAEGLVQILLADGTAFTIGPNSALTIDSFIYDPSANTASVAATFTKGVFRFVGGRTSKTGGATITTPIGEIGVRGAIVSGDSGDGSQPAHIDLVAGEQLTLSQGGNVLGTVYQSGYSLVSGGQAQKTPSAWTAAVTGALTSRPGTTGGATHSPTSQQAAALAPATGSNNSAAANTASGSASTATTGQQQQQQQPEKQVVDVSQASQSTTTSQPQPHQLPIRVLSAGPTHVTNFDFETLNPGTVGLVGYADLTHVHPNAMDQVGFLTVPPGATSGTIALAQGQLTLPAYSNTTFTTHTVTNVASPFGGPLSGTAYSNAGGFAAYILGVNGDVTQPVYAIAGETFANVPSVFQGTDLRRYTYTQDPIQQVPIPFFRSGDLSSFAGTVSTDFYIIDTPSFAQADPKMFQASLAIEGAGFAQQSAIELTVADIFDNGGHYTAGTGRAGSYRGGATVASYHDYGGQDLLTNSTGSSDFYGANAQNFLMTSSVDVDDAFGAASASLADPFSVFSTLHVANLAATTPVSSVTRTSRSLTGFSAGVLEVSADNSTYQLAVLASPIDQPGIRMLLDPDSNSLGGEISANDVFDLVEADQLHVAFGFGIDGNTQYGPSTLISDDMFGADENNDRTLGYVTTDSSGTYTQRSNLDPAVYMVSSEAVPQTGAAFWGTAQPCTCKFLEWGWWGAQLQTADPNGSPTDEVVRDSVHLGTWVAGDVVDYSELPTSGSATYNGHAVGNVVADTGSGDGTYVAAGTMAMTWDFLPRTGTVSITNFDSHSFSGAVGDPAVPSDPSALFSGSLSGSGLSGTVNGAFVRNGTDAAGGVIGDFAVSGAGYAASGIIAGGRAP